PYPGPHVTVTRSHLLRLLWAMTVSQAFLVFDDLDSFEENCSAPSSGSRAQTPSHTLTAPSASRGLSGRLLQTSAQLRRVRDAPGAALLGARRPPSASHCPAQQQHQRHQLLDFDANSPDLSHAGPWNTLKVKGTGGGRSHTSRENSLWGGSPPHWELGPWPPTASLWALPLLRPGLFLSCVRRSQGPSQPLSWPCHSPRAVGTRCVDRSQLARHRCVRQVKAACKTPSPSQKLELMFLKRL
ncbi:hypothetical protein J1605_002290, partial [Eschrichtius robustus]